MKKRRRITKSYYNYYYKQKSEFLKKYIKKLSKNNNFNDFLQNARIELLYSMINFDSTFNTSFNTYLCQRIYNNIRHYIVKSKKEKNVLLDIDFVGQSNINHQDNKILLKEIFSILSEKEMKILTMCFFNSDTLEEAGAKLGISAASAFNIKNKAIQKIRNKFSV